MSKEVQENTSMKVLKTALGFSTLAAATLGGAEIANASGNTDSSNNHQYTIVVRRVPFYDFGGRVDIFDLRIDPWFEEPITGGDVKAIDKVSGKTLSERSYSLVEPKLNLLTPKKGETNVAWSVLQWTGDADSVTNANTPSGKTRTVPSKEVIIETSQDSSNKTFPVTAVDGGIVNMWDGQRIKTAQQFLDEYKKHPELARDLTPQMLTSIQETAQKEASSNPMTSATPVATPDVKALQDQINQLKAEVNANKSAEPVPAPTVASGATNKDATNKDNGIVSAAKVVGEKIVNFGGLIWENKNLALIIAGGLAVAVVGKIALIDGFLAGRRKIPGGKIRGGIPGLYSKIKGKP